MTDQTRKPDPSAPATSPTGAPLLPVVADYDLADQLVLEGPTQHRALFEETRMEIVNLLRQRAATVTELAATLGKPKGTVAHHMKTLEEAGLVRVVRTEQVRAITAKYYGRTAAVFIFDNSPDVLTENARILGDAQRYFARAADTQERTDEFRPSLNVRFVRVSPARLQVYFDRMQHLLEEFAREPQDDASSHTLLIAAYPTTHEATHGGDA